VATQGPIGRVLYGLIQLSGSAAGPLLGGLRHYNVPPLSQMQGGVLVASNHQSFYDPVLIGMRLPRPICFLARDTLFEVPGFGAAIWSVGARPVRRGSVSPDAIRTVIGLLRSGEGLLMFPEGTRTPDGELGPFSPGAASVAIRCGVPVLPVCVEGAFRSWPRTRLLPRPSPMAVAFGEPISSGGQTADELTQRMRGEILRLRGILRERLAWRTR
jgi:1-acyl-sn-glycerol-3-phosphate acyltransferase